MHGHNTRDSRRTDGERQTMPQKRSTNESGSPNERRGVQKEHLPRGSPTLTKRKAEAPPPHECQLSPPEGKARGRTLATLSSPEDTKVSGSPSAGPAREAVRCLPEKGDTNPQREGTTASEYNRVQHEQSAERLCEGVSLQ